MHNEVRGVLMMAMLLVAVGCDDGPHTGAAVTAEHRALLVRELGRAVPSRAHLLVFQREQGMDEAILAKLEMPPADAESLLSQPPFSLVDLASDSASLPASIGADAWRPSSMKNARSGQAPLTDGRVLHVRTGEERLGVVAVYLLVHGT